MTTTIISEQDRGYYIFREEKLKEGGEPEITMKNAYALDGSYIGSDKDGEYLKNKGIKPQRKALGDNTATIGFCESENKWYGWSHRAMYGFKVGDKVESGSVLEESLGVGFLAVTIDDCKLMASKYADAVG